MEENFIFALAYLTFTGKYVFLPLYMPSLNFFIENKDKLNIR